MDKLKPTDYAEEVALYRAEVIGALTRCALNRGELWAALVALSQKRFRPPRGTRTRTYAVSTLQRWYYRYKRGGLDALRPKSRSDRGRATKLTEAQRRLLCDIRREHRSASVPLILDTLVRQGRIDPAEVSQATVRRLFSQQGLDRVSLRERQGIA